MSRAIPGHDVSVPGSSPRSGPVARVSHGVLAANARLASASGIRCFDASILMADAWGHGVELVRQVLERHAITPSTHPDTAHAPALHGHSLYGLPGGDPAATPALRLTGTVLSVKDLRAGEGVSYGYAYRAPHDTRVALVTGGYAQGVVRALGGAVDVWLAGERHPIVGRVAMDVCVVEIANAQTARGDEALFLGDPAQGEPSLVEWTRASGLDAAELITTVGLRAIREASA